MFRLSDGLSRNGTTTIDRADGGGGWSAVGAHGAVSCYRCGPRAVEIGKKLLFGTRTVFRYKWIRRSHVTAGSDRRVTFSPGAGRHRSIGRDRAARNKLVMAVVTISSTKRRGSMFLAQPPAVALRAPLLLNEPQSTLR